MLTLFFYISLNNFVKKNYNKISNIDTNNKIKEVINNKKKEVKTLSDELHLGIFQNNTGKTNIEERIKSRDHTENLLKNKNPPTFNM